jgi:hypothetical protein
MRTVLLLKSANPRLVEIEGFLRGRGYDITSVDRIHEAVRFITDKRPDFALLSAELIPARSGWLFGVLNQLTSVIVFAERVSAKNLALTRELKETYLLEPPLTPLGFEKILHRAERDRELRNRDADRLDKTQVWIMSALSDLALKALCVPHAGPIEPVDKVSRVTCLRVQTAKLAGYFILAYGQSRALPAAWLERLRETVREYLKAFDDRAAVDPGQEIVIEEVRFNAWSKDQAEFIRQASHEESELVLAFFKDPVAEPMATKPSTRKGHVEIGLQHLPGDSVVDFDVYIYLPQNARFILYTPRGGTFYEVQKQKLLTDGIRSVHIPKRSLDEVRRQRTQKFIENSAQAFQ